MPEWKNLKAIVLICNPDFLYLPSVKSISHWLVAGSFRTLSLGVTHLRPSVGHVQVMQGDILDDLLLLVDVPLGQRHVLLGLQVKLCGKGVTATLSLWRQRNELTTD